MALRATILYSQSHKIVEWSVFKLLLRQSNEREDESDPSSAAIDGVSIVTMKNIMRAAEKRQRENIRWID